MAPRDKNGPHHRHDRAPEAVQAVRAPYLDFVDELFRLGRVDAEKRDFLRRGLAATGTDAAIQIAQPSSAGIAYSDAAARRAAASGLVRQTAPRKTTIGCGSETVHWGYLWGAEEPIAIVQPGDEVTIDTVSHEGLLSDQGDPVGFFTRFGIPADEVLADAVAVYTKVQHSGLGGHIVSGPIYVESAEPGDVLAVHVLEVTPRTPYGVNTMRMNRGSLPDEFTLNRSTVIPFDMERGVAKFAPKIEVPLRPFFGIMATGPARSLGKISSGPPGPFGGNIDLKELTVGSTLYLPVFVPGALFMCGDGHAAQGDSEVDLTAIETSLTGTTATHWITLGLHENLEEAMKMAIRETIDFLANEKRLSREDAYALASIAVDFEVTQVVDGVKGIHGMIPKAIFLD